VRIRRHNVRKNSSDLLVTSTQVTAVMPSMRYLDSLFGLRCGPQLVESGVYPNAKEYTEAAAMWDACATELDAHGYPLKGPDTLCVVVGDGSTPRLGTMMALRSAWTVLSVDPQLKWDGWIPDRLHLAPVGVEELPDWGCRSGFIADPFWDEPGHAVVVLACHAHVDLGAALTGICGLLPCECEDHTCAVVAMPCCKDLNLGALQPTVTYEDWACLSPKREVRVWREAVLR